MSLFHNCFTFQLVKQLLNYWYLYYGFSCYAKIISPSPSPFLQKHHSKIRCLKVFTSQPRKTYYIRHKCLQIIQWRIRVNKNVKRGTTPRLDLRPWDEQQVLFIVRPRDDKPPWIGTIILFSVMLMGRYWPIFVLKVWCFTWNNPI